LQRCVGLWQDTENRHRRAGHRSFEKLTPRHAGTPDQSIIDEPFDEPGGRCVQFGDTEEDPIAQTTKRETLNDENSLFDLTLSPALAELLYRGATPCRRKSD
jgi:hypothetical protein